MDRAERATQLLAALMSNPSVVKSTSSASGNLQQLVSLAYTAADMLEPAPFPSGRGDYRGEGSVPSKQDRKPLNPDNEHGGGGSKGEGGTKRFVPPSVQDVAQYMAEYRRDHNMSMFNPRNVAHEFVDYYTACGWSVGRKKMKDWRAAVRNWLRRMDEYPSTQTQEKQWSGRPLVY